MRKSPGEQLISYFLMGCSFCTFLYLQNGFVPAFFKEFLLLEEECLSEFDHLEEMIRTVISVFLTKQPTQPSFQSSKKATAFRPSNWRIKEKNSLSLQLCKLIETINHKTLCRNVKCISGSLWGISVDCTACRWPEFTWKATWSAWGCSRRVPSRTELKSVGVP